MTEVPVGFAVVYRWKLREEREREFRDAWERASHPMTAAAVPRVVQSP